MTNFIIYDSKGKILRAGNCQNRDFKRQVHPYEFLMQGTADIATQKIVDGEIVDKTPEEIKIVEPQLEVAKIITHEKQSANITNKQWQNMLDRLEALEKI